MLIVDDDASIRKTLARILEKQGYLVEAVEKGKQAIEATSQRFFNVAFIDIRLPDMDGTELLERMRETEPKMVKIILTGYPSLKNSIDAVNKGADGYLMKPFDVGKLLAMVKQQLEKQEESMRFSEKKVTTYIETRVKQIELQEGKKRAC
jgi:DNA-binding NtrC family response regulator